MRTSGKVYGFYTLRHPSIIISDPEVIKNIGIRDFDHFTNHKSIFGADDGNILGKSLLILEDNQWKQMRNILTPAFTGKKMRIMYELVNRIGIQGAKYIEDELKASGKGELELDMKEYFTRFTNDVIATTAFGISVNSFKDKTNTFYTIGTAVTALRGWVLVKAFLYTAIPKVMRFFKIRMMDENKLNYLSELIYSAIKHRRAHDIVRPDMINLLMEAQQRVQAEKANQSADQHATFTDEDILAQCVIFFFAGFETVSTSLCMTTFELCRNLDVQQRLYEEIMDVEQQLNGQPLNYDALMSMKYLEMVISEGLRKWPPAILIDRRCGMDYKVTNDDGTLIAEIKKDEVCLIPVVALHHDPKYWPEPEKFDPERFSDENKKNIVPMTYLPFGVGPRACIGNRMALMETKSIIYHICRQFKIVPAAKTPIDLMDAIKGFRMEPKEGFWMKFVPREA